MKVFIAQNGRTLDVDAQPSSGVAALQNMLVPLCDIPAADQILILSGKPLDARRQLSAYGLPAADGGGAVGVFLYSKALMRQHAPMPALEVLAPVTINATRLDQVPYEPHMLDAASSPLISALPQYERSFMDHLSIGQAYHGAMQERLTVAAHLAQEMTVQAAAIEAARSNVEHHYSYICTHFREFMAWFQGQAHNHAEVLGRFERDLRLLSSVNILPAAQTQQYKCLGDLVPEEQYSDWATKCSATHENLVKRVGEVDSMFQALRAEVEALFMTGPSVSLEAVSTELQNMHTHVANEECVLQVLQRDCAQVQRLVEEAVRQLSAPAAASSATPLDNCQLMEAMNDNHIAQLLPRLRACDDSVAAFCQRCIDSKNQMTADVVGHLRSISGQQSKIRGLRQKLQILREATAKQDTAVSHLLFVRRVPAVYRQCLAECMRRAAFGELFAGQAGQLAERMGRLRQKEAAKREGFLKHAEGYVPRPVLGALGLLGQPAHCQISVPATEPGLLTVTLEDIQNVPISAEAPDASRSSIMGASQQPPSTPTSARAGDPSASAAFPSPLHISEGDGEGEAEAEAEAGGGTPRSLEMENARLRAEVATQYAHEAARSLLTGDASHMAASMQRSLQIGEPQASPSTDQAAVARFRAALAAREEVEAHLESELAAARAQAASYEHRIRQLEGRLLRSAMRTSPSASMRGSGRSSGSPTSSFSGGSGHLAPVSEGVEGRPVRRTLRDSQDAGKDAAAAVSSSQAGAPAQAHKASGVAAVGMSQTGTPSDAAKESAAKTVDSVQTSIPQGALRNAAAPSSISQIGKDQVLLGHAATPVGVPQTSSVQAEGGDAGTALSTQVQGGSTSGPDSNPIARGSPRNTESYVDQASPSIATAAATGVHQSALPGGGSGHMPGSSTRSILPTGSSQTAQDYSESRTTAEESRVGAGARYDAGKGVAGSGKEQLPQLQELGRQPGALEAQGHAAALTDMALQQVDQGPATGEVAAEPGRPAATRRAAEPRPIGAVRLGTPFAAAAGTPSSSPGQESSLAAQASDSASPAGSALPFAASTAVSGLSAMPSLAPHDPPQLPVPVPDVAAGPIEASGEVVRDPPARSPAPLLVPAAPTVSGAAAGGPAAASTPLEASTAAGACPVLVPDTPAAGGVECASASD